MRRLSMLMLLFTAVAAVAILRGANSGAEERADEQVDVSASNEPSETAANDTVRAVPEVIAYYFHTTNRCASCKKIEAYSREAIESGFAEELKNGKLKFESVNIDETDNKHFVKDYQLYTKSLVICNMEDEKQVEWKNLARVWQLLGNKDEFIKYVRNEVDAYLKGS